MITILGVLLHLQQIVKKISSPKLTIEHVQRFEYYDAMLSEEEEINTDIRLICRNSVLQHVAYTLTLKAQTFHPYKIML